MAGTCVAWFAGGIRHHLKASTVDGAVKASNAFGFDFYLQARRGQGQLRVLAGPERAIALTMVAAGRSRRNQAELLRTLAHRSREPRPDLNGSFAEILTVLESAATAKGPA